MNARGSPHNVFFPRQCYQAHSNNANDSVCRKGKPMFDLQSQILKTVPKKNTEIVHFEEDHEETK